MSTARRYGYVGTWILVPELCIYEEGNPPLSGVYRIAQIDDVVQISIDWQAQDGSKHQIQFQAPDSGVRQPGKSGAPDLSITRVSPLILDSRAYVGDDEVAYAHRRASDDGRLLATVQVGRRPDGTSFRNFQVYRRQDAGSV